MQNYNKCLLKEIKIRTKENCLICIKVTYIYLYRFLKRTRIRIDNNCDRAEVNAKIFLFCMPERKKTIG